MVRSSRPCEGRVVAAPLLRKKIVLLGDVHDHGPRLRRALETLSGETWDLALQVGDVGVDPPWLSPSRERDRAEHDASVRRVLASLREAAGCPVVFVPGNHDLPSPPSDAPALNADGRVVEVDGLRVGGLGGSGPHRHGFPYEWSESDASRALDRLGQGRVDILLCHAPPARTSLDRMHDGEHVGSSAVRRAIASLRPALFVCGHIHEAWGVEETEGVPCVNAGALGEPFGQAIVWTVQWNDGPVSIDCHHPEETVPPGAS